MKIRTTSFLVALCGMFAATTMTGQVTRTWIGGTNGVPADLGAATNWSGGVQVNPNNGDTAQFDGAVAGPMHIFYSGAGNSYLGGNAGGNGITWLFTSNQISSVTITSSVASSANCTLTGFNVYNGAGSVTLGSTDTTFIINFINRPNGGTKLYINDSTNPVFIRENVAWQSGGASAWTMDMSGAGDWRIFNYLVNNNSSGKAIQVDGPGKVYWTPTGFLGNSGWSSPAITINTAGILILQGSHPKLSNQGIVNNGTFIFDAPSAAQTLSGAISGTGLLQVNNGTLTLSSGGSSFGTNILLTGGELIVAGTENPGAVGPLGVGGTITFSGGTLGFSGNNSFDYSSRFDTNNNQAVSIDTAGQVVTFASGLDSTGGTLTKLGTGTLTLTGTNTYTGLTTVGLGILAYQGPKTGTGDITLAAGATTLAIDESGIPVTTGTLTVGVGATLEFDNVTNLATAPLVAGAVSASGPVNINVGSGIFKTIGQAFPLLTCTSGVVPAVALGTINGAGGTLTTNGNTIVLNISATPYVWTGSNGINWDLTTPNNWVQSGVPKVFANGALAVLDDSSVLPSVQISGGVIQPGSVTFNNSLNTYYFYSDQAGDNLGGSTGLTKQGTNLLMMIGGGNTYTGVTTLKGGLVNLSILANGGSPSDLGASGNAAANLVLNGGILQYAGGQANIDRLFTIGTGGGTIDHEGYGPLSLTNTGTIALGGSGPRAFTLTGSETDTNLVASVFVDSGGGPTSLVKSGSGRWALTGNNTYSGLTTISGGTLQIGVGTGAGTLGSGNVVNNGSLDFNLTNTYTIGATISGSGGLVNDGSGTLILTGNNNYGGTTRINAGTVQFGNGGTTAPCPDVPIVNNGTAIFNSKIGVGITLNTFGAVISGAGNVIVRNGTTLAAISGSNPYTGWTLVESGATFQPSYGNQGAMLGSSVVTNNGTMFFSRQDSLAWGYSNNIVGTGKVVKENNNQNPGDILLAGTNNTYTGGTLIRGGGIVLGDGVTPGSGAIVGSIVFTNTSTSYLNQRYLWLNRPDDFTFTNLVTSSVNDGSLVGNQGILAKINTNITKVILTANNVYPGGTVLGAGILQVGNGGTSGAIGTGNVTITNGGVLSFDRSDSYTFGGAINDGTATAAGSGSVWQIGSGTTTLTASNGYVGSTVVSNGTLVVAGGYIGGDLFVEGGTIAGAASGTISNLTVAGNMYIDSGTVLATLNKGLTPMNSFFTVTNAAFATNGTITATGGILKLVNVGAAVAPNDKFTIFSGPVTGGASMTVILPGATVANNLATDGSITVTALAPNPTITASASSGSLHLAWPSVWTGLHLQIQTNSLSKGIGTNWITLAGTDASTNYTAVMTLTNGCTFYRLAP